MHVQCHVLDIGMCEAHDSMSHYNVKLEFAKPSQIKVPAVLPSLKTKSETYFNIAFEVAVKVKKVVVKQHNYIVILRGIVKRNISQYKIMASECLKIWISLFFKAQILK